MRRAMLLSLTGLASTVLLIILAPAAIMAQQYAINTVAGTGQVDSFAGTTISPGFASGVALDSAGNVYLAVSDASVVVRLDAVTGKQTVLAGTGVAGYSGDNGIATSAQLNAPVAVAVDGSGNVYIADSLNQRIRQVSNGTIVTVAGNGVLGQSGDNGPAISAELANPGGIAVDSAGNLYILELGFYGGYNDVRKVSNGIISTVQGVDPFGARNIAVDSAGNIYWADGFCNVWAVLNQVPTVVAGVNNYPCAGFSGDNGPATSAQLSGPLGVALDASGNLYFADTGNNRVRRVSQGIITTVAGNGSIGAGGDGGPATAAQLTSPAIVGATTPGTFYIIDSGNQRLRKVSQGVISSVVGNVTISPNGDNGPATAATLALSPSVSVDASGNIFIADAGSHTVRKITDGVITTVAGNGTQGYSGDSGPAVNAELNGPVSVTVDAAGNLYVADTGNQRVRKISNGTITTVAGNGTQGYSGDNGPAVNAQLKLPLGVAVDSAGTLYISDTGNQAVRKVVNGVISAVAGVGYSGDGGDNGPAIKAQLNGPAGLAVDAAGNLYIADSTNSRIRKISNGVITSVAGVPCCSSNSPRGYNGDNIPATSAELNYPVGVAVDARGNLFIADGLNQRIRKVSNGLISTIAGNGTGGYGGDGGPATSAELAYPTAVAVDVNGNIYIADTGNRRIRAIGPSPTISGLSPNSVLAGASAFSLTISGGGFQPQAAAEWNGSALTTTYVSNAQLTASVPASLLATVTSVPITVVNSSSLVSNAVTFSVVAPFSVSSNPAALTVAAPGGGASATITVTPATGFSGPVGLSCTVAYNGQGNPHEPPTCSVSPAQVSVTSPNTGTTTLSIASTAPHVAMAWPKPGSKGWAPFAGSGGFIIAFALGGILPQRRPSRKTLLRRIGLSAFLMVVFLTLLMAPACGGGGGGSGSGGNNDPGTTTGSYTVTVNAGSGSYATSISVPLTVQ